MSKRMWTGLLAGLLGVLALAGVAGIAYNVGRDDRVVRTVGDGEVVRVVGHGWGGHGYGYGPRPGFFLFPLLLFGLIALLIWGTRGGWGGGRRPWGGGHWAGGGPEGTFAEWHRRAHSSEQPAPAPAPPPGPAPGETGPPAPTV